MKKPTQKELDRMLEFWQRILRLQDWDVRVSMCRAEEIGHDCLGRVDPVLTKKSARIRILDPIDFGDDSLWKYDFECYLVHELLHLHFESFMDKSESPAHTAQEQAIESIATGLVNLHRKGQ